MEKNLIILRGVPGSGKTTVAELLSDGALLDYPICCADDYFTDENGVYNWYPSGIKKAHEASQAKCKTAMLHEVERIIVANTNTTEKEMKPYYDMAKEFGYKVFSLIVENRHGGENSHEVPEATIEKMKNRFDIQL